MIHERPWGTFEVLLDEPNYKVKRIVVFPRQRFSLQYHNHREEHWTIVEGSGIITIGDEEQQVKPGDHFYIPVKGIHRLMGHDNGVLFIEVQRGICLPDDIIRLEDDYGRD